MIKQIFKQIWVERRINAWLLLELTGMFICLLVMTDFFLIKWSNYNEPTGFDIDNTYLLKMKMMEEIAPDYIDPALITETGTEELQRLISQIRQYPDIEAASVSYVALPYSNSGFFDLLFTDTAVTVEKKDIHVRGRRVTPEYFDVFRVRSYNGEPIRVIPDGTRQIVLSKEASVELFSSVTNAVGKRLFGAEGNEFVKYAESRTARITAVCTDIKVHEFVRYSHCFFEVLDPVSFNAYVSEAGASRADICVRVRPGSAQHFEEFFEVEMGERLRVNNMYVSSITSFNIVRDDMVGKIIREGIQTMLYIVLFALITVSLGIFGAFWLRSRQRSCEIGIRMAMGAGKSVIKKEMIAESLCLMIIAMIPSLIVYVNLLYMDMLNTVLLEFTFGRVLIVMFLSLFVMSAVILTSTFWPANRAASIQPVDALRDE